MDHPVVLFDGECNLCNWSVQFIIQRDLAARFRFASVQSPVALIAASELRSLETAHLLRSPRNAERLLRARARTVADEGTPQTVADLRHEVGLAPQKSEEAAIENRLRL